MPLLGQYLDSIGFTGTQIGSITSAGAAAAIVASIFWGRVYKKSENKKRLISKLVLTSAIFCVALYFVNIYIVFLLMLCVLYFFQAPSVLLLDAMTVEDGLAFGTIRKWGAVGFALGVFLAGMIAEYIGLSVIFSIYVISFSIFTVIIYRMSKVAQRDSLEFPEHETAGKSTKRVDDENRINLEVNSDTEIQADLETQQSFDTQQNFQAQSDFDNKQLSLNTKSKKTLYKNRKYINLVVCAFFILGSITANNTYFGFLFVEGGGNLAGIGVAFLLMAGSEAPFMAWTSKLAKVFTLERTLLVAILLSVARFAWYASGPPALLLLIFFFLQGMTTGIIIVEFVRYIAKVVNEEDLGFAISLYYALGGGLSGIFCQMIGGILLDHFGASGVYAFFAIMNFIGACIYMIGRLHKEEAEKK